MYINIFANILYVYYMYVISIRKYLYKDPVCKIHVFYAHRILVTLFRSRSIRYRRLSYINTLQTSLLHT